MGTDRIGHTALDVRAVFAKRTITRIEGSIMVLCYIAYTTFLIYSL